jgi:cob(I)alamin adenosyltransferase
MEKRLLHVYTGNGKGKTTAALGLCMRAAGRGWKALVVQFMKGMDYGELHAFASVPNVAIEQFGRTGFVDKCRPDPEDPARAARALDRARQALASGDFDLVVLDEVNVAIEFGLLQTGDVLDALKNRAPGTEAVCTGRYAPAALMDMADLVTDMREIKHPYMKDIPAREGIEF